MHGRHGKLLEALLLSLFEADELYRFIRSLGHEFRISLRPGLALAELVDDALSLVDRHQYWGEFFTRLVLVKGHAYERIAAVASVAQIYVVPPRPPSEDTIELLIGPSDGPDTFCA